MSTINGTAGNDSILPGGVSAGVTGGTTGTGFDSIIGSGGSDSINGAGGFDVLDYSGLAAANKLVATINADLTGSVLKTGLGTDSIAGVTSIYGTAGNDSLTVSLGISSAPGLNWRGNAGNDTLTGNTYWWVTADYGNSPTGVAVDLQAGTATDGWGGTDSLVGVVSARGSAGNDTLLGNTSTFLNDGFAASSGNDSIDGRGGFDFLGYGDLSGGVSIVLTGIGTGTAQKGFVGAPGSTVPGALGTDTFTGVEGFNGSANNDYFAGTTATAQFQQVWFEGWGGNDIFDGWFNATNVLSYNNSPTGVTVDLLAGTATDGWGGTDSMINVAAVVGSSNADSLKGGNIASATTLVYLQGGRGNDTIDGANNSYNLADYNVFPATGITANLATGQVQDGQGGTDTLLNKAGLRGSTANDTILAGSYSAYVDGNSGLDRMDYSGLGSATITVTLGLNITATVSKTISGNTTTDTLSGVEQIIGTAGNDTFNGSSSSSFTSTVAMQGGAGADSFNGFSNFWNAVDYSNSPGGVVVDLGLGTAQDGLGFTDTLTNVVAVIASDNADSLKGGSGNDTFVTGRGNDTVDGSTGFNSLDYSSNGSSSGARLSASFSSNTGGSVVKTLNSSGVGTDSFSNIQRIRGSGGNDTLLGTTLTSGTTITLEGDAGNDSIDGKSSLLNFVSYSSSFQSVTVDLAAGTASDGWGGTDTLLNVRRVGGGSASDTLKGSGGDEWFAGTNGSDSIDGRGGTDVLDYTTQSSGVTLSFTGTGSGTAAKGLAGTDSFTGIEIVQGSNGNDSIAGYASASSNTWLRGMNGNDTIDAAGNAFNIIDYNGQGTAVTINLGTGVVTGVGTDLLLNYVSIRGSTGNDVFRSGAGNFTLDGGNGFGTLGNVTSPGVGGGDALDYRGYAVPITLNNISNNSGANAYYSGSVTKADGTDSFSSIRGIFASTGNDSLVGTANTTGSNAFVMRGEAGNDTIDGRGALNALDYIDSPTGVLVRLQTTPGGALAGTAQDGWGGTDVVLGFTSVRGSDAGNDTLVGSDRGDFFWGTKGNDSIDGVNGNDAMNYNNGLFQVGFSGAIDAVFTNGGTGLFGFAQASVFKAGGNYDTLVNVNQVLATPNADVLRGLNNVAYTWNNTVLRGNAGNDTIYGYNSSFNRVDYSSATAAVSIDLGLGTDAKGQMLGSAQDGLGGTDLLVGVVSLRGSNFNDTLLGSALNDSFTVGSSGSHLVNGRGGSSNEIRYNNADAVTIDLGTVLTNDGFGGYQGSISKAGGTDTLLNIAVAQGGSGNDTVYGSPANNQLSGGAGDNSIDGRGGYDTLNYRPFTGITAPTHGAVIDLGDGILGSATNPWGGTDTLLNIEGATGSQFDDDITGAVLSGGGVSFIRGDGGNDTLRAPTDDTAITADYLSSLSGIVADLSTGVVSDDGWFGGHDTLVNLHALRASNFDDLLTGSSGDDTLDGAGGSDVVVFHSTQAQTSLTLNLDGSWTATGPDGTDLLLRVEIARFSDGDVRLGSVQAVSGTSGGDTIRPGASSTGVTGFVSAQGDSILGNGGNDQIQGGAGNDSITGGSGDDIFFSSAGNDSITGGGGTDRLSFAGPGQGSQGVLVNLAAGTDTNSFGGHDTLVNIRNVEGSAFNDTLLGTDILQGSNGSRFYGSAGSDSIDGNLVLARNVADYSTLVGTINASFTDLTSVTVAKAPGGSDTLVHINSIIGTDGNDSLAGLSTGTPAGLVVFSINLAGGAGNDSINGFNNSLNRADYSLATSAAVINLATGTASDGQGGTDTLTNVTAILASSFNDTITGGTGSDVFLFTLLGNHSLDGGTGNNTYRYGGSEDVLVDLADSANPGFGRAVKAGGAIDTFKNISGAAGADGNDTLLGSASADTLQGGAGNNLLDGRAGDNWVRYDGFWNILPSHGVTLSLQAGTALTPWNGTEKLFNIQNAIGTAFADSLMGTSANNGTFSSLRGMLGDDTLAAPFANTHVQADYSQDIAGVTVNLASGTATDGWGGHDTLVNIQAVRGSNLADSITGSALGDIITGGTGNDTIEGGAGLDIAIFNSTKAGSTVTTLAGVTTVAGPDGTDVLTNVEVLRFNDGDVVLSAINVEGTSGNDTIRVGFSSTGVVGTLNNNGQVIFGGGGGNDFLQGGSGNDSLLGGNGNDSFSGGSGNDTFSGGGGTDQISYTGNGQGNGAVTVNLTTGTATNTAGGHDVLIGIRNAQGGNGNDTLIGSDVLSGAANIPGYPSSGSNFISSGGSDSVDGVLPLASNAMTYLTAAGNLTVSYTDWHNATVVKSTGGTDTLVNITNLNGNSGNDSISGSLVDPGLDIYSQTLNLLGGAGNDTIDGHGLSINRARYNNATGAVVANLETGVVQDGQGGTDQLINVRRIQGSNFNDTITGSSGNDTIHTSMLGNHLLDGGAGQNSYSYALSNTLSIKEGVLIDLGTTAASGGGWQGFVLKATGAQDTLLRFNLGSGSDGNDTLLGTPDGDTLTGGAGDNLLDGRGGQNWVSYGTAFSGLVPTHGATVNLATGTATNPWDGTDTLLNLQSVVGTPYGDSLTGQDPGNGNTSFLQGRAGDDTLAAGSPGTHVVADYNRDAAGVTANLASGSATDGWGGHDTLININAVRGSLFDDTLTGGAGNDTFMGNGGNDSIEGGGGSNTAIFAQSSTQLGLSFNADGSIVVTAANGTTTLRHIQVLQLQDTTINQAALGGDASLQGGAGNDTLNGGDGNDTLNGGTGADSMAGGLGNDTYLVDNAGDVVSEASNAGTDTVVTGLAYTLGANVENLLLTGSIGLGGTGNTLDNRLTGTSGNDTLSGDAGNDTLDGGAGADSMSGGSGNDTYLVDNAGDVVNEATSAGTDTVQTSLSYALGANVENLLLTGSTGLAGTGNTMANLISGTSGADTLNGSAGNDTLLGNGGDDQLNGGTGADSMVGGTGNDTYTVDHVGDVVVEAAGEGTDTVKTNIAYTLADNVENLVLTGSTGLNGSGNALDNSLTGTTGNDTLSGAGGDDTLTGGTGADSMLGGTGNDTYVVDNAGDQVVEAAGEGTDTVKANIAFTLADNVENLVLTGTIGLAGTGNAMDNSLTGTSGADTLDGGGGADSLTGGSGNDTYLLDNAGDLVTEASNGGTDIVFASASYTLAANVENLTLTGALGLAGTGNTMANVLLGSSGDDTLDGASGKDSMAGGQGNDTYVVDNAGDVVTEANGEGTDTVRTGLSYTLGANLENLVLTGSTGLNGTGNALDNSLTGTSGNDTLTGAAGNDTMAGGAGNDTYVLDSSGDVVTEAPGEGTDLVKASAAFTLGDNVENLTLVGAIGLAGTGNGQDNTLLGSTGNDTLLGMDGNDTLDGGAGADSMAGGTGNDTYVLDNAGDQVSEAPAEGTDTVKAGFSYTLGDNVENLVLTGSTGQAGTGNALANNLAGTSGADTLDGGTGADTMAGGAGNDTYYVDNAGDVVTESNSGGVDTVVTSMNYTLGSTVENLVLTGALGLLGGGSSAANLITGTSGNDTLNGNAGNDTLLGNGGDDSLSGGSGADSMAGGDGNDTYVVDNAGDVAVEASGEGTDLVKSSVSFTLGDNVENLTLTGALGLAGTGNALDNALVGTGGADTLDGGGGADSMTGGGGNDTYVVDNIGDVITETSTGGVDTVVAAISYTLGGTLENLTLSGPVGLSGTGNGLANVLTGGLGDDTLSAGNGNDTVNGGAGNDSMLGGAGNDSMFGDIGDDSLVGGTGDDSMLGGDGADTLNGGAGNDTADGGAGDDMMTGDDGLNLLFGGIGNDTLYGGLLTDTLNGGDGADWLFGADGNDSLSGGNDGDAMVGGTGDDSMLGDAGNDWMQGDTGNDSLVGGTGDDFMQGGDGADTFFFAAGSGQDRVLDFLHGTDHLNIAGFGLADFTAVQGHASVVAEGLRISNDSGDAFVLAGVAAGVLTVGDFIFT